MQSIDTTQWRDFIVGRLFDVYKPEVFHKRNVSEASDGIPYVTRSKFNNGMKYRVNKTSEVNPSGVISFGAENASFFYQEEEWCSGRDMYYIDTRHLTLHSCLFLVSCLSQIARKYSYSFGLFPDLIKKEIIRLPVNPDGNPDWAYMDSYMREQTEESQKHITRLTSILRYKSAVINTSKWKEFSIKDLFGASNTGNILLRDVDDGSGNTPYVTASGINNGVVARIDASPYEIIKGHGILIGGKTFTLTYQEEDFVSNDSHNIVIRLKDDKQGTENVYLFLITVIRCALTHKYQWIDAITKPALLEETILLPTDTNNNPDWEYMENYMQRINQKCRSKVESLS